MAGVPELRGLLARAYADDPLMRWIFPDDATRADATAAWLGLFVEAYVGAGGVDVLDVERGARGEPSVVGSPPEAVAVWRMPGAALVWGAAPSVGGLLAALVGVERAREIGAGLAQTRGLAPDEPHAYLHFLAVDPERQGRGRGREVLAPGLARATGAGLGVHLETTNARAVPFYERLGFEVTAQITLGDDGPPLWAMWRSPDHRP
ncbi:N-acetyltransferase [Flavimobilis marinus]|uniref:Acetyltransferase (GNAT) family protein n=1 Tax=Flavimobilis marinus TaxID=285351 RepID=A0A1I2DU25_9MICO|nr:GNAT family N-acetyltransferase [Flavimobilis marinus]GHG44461.1 N-acetyltransferase [Flavimobilis marinus]SFE83430.1 Acetyltransferase (GNAT) family protein [Flavimobilis marinus]